MKISSFIFTEHSGNVDSSKPKTIFKKVIHLFLQILSFYIVYPCNIGVFQIPDIR